MAKKAFIHLSDLHVAAIQGVGYVDNSERAGKTWLVAQKDEDNHNYIDKFCSFVKKHFDKNEYDLYLLISGDVADASEQDEYEYASVFIQKIKQELSIADDRVLIVPGNHDINRFECRKTSEANPSVEAYKCNVGKYKYFAEFYKKVTRKDFPLNNAIVDSMSLDEEKVLFVGLNSNYKIGYKDEKGYIDIEGFRNEIDSIIKNKSNYIKIAVFHHNIITKYMNDPSHFGSFQVDNWDQVQKELEANDFRCVLYGNEHTRSSNKIEKQNLYCSDSGCFGLKKPQPSFKIYELEQNDCKTVFKQSLFLFDINNSADNPLGNWIKVDPTTSEELEEFVLREKPANEVLHTTDIIPNSLASPKDNQSEQKALQDFAQQKKEFREKLIKILKEENLFHQGHFHWGKNSRSLNWIDTISLLSDRSHTKLIQRELLDVIKNNNIDCRYVIGVGIEGNILSSALLGKAESYTYLPYSYRYDEANKCERNLCVSNEDKSIKQVLVITDVVHKGRTLRTLFEERESVFFKNIDEINVVSLFYTGGNKRGDLPEGLADMRDRVRFLSLVDLEVGKCPYDDDYRSECSNYNHRLCEVYKFYNE